MILRYEDRFSSLELSKKLKQLGVRQDSEYQWSNYEFLDADNVGWLKFPAPVVVCGLPYNCEPPGDLEWCAAYTSAELGQLLPPELNINGKIHSLVIWSGTHPEFSHVRSWSINYKEIVPRGKESIFGLQTIWSYLNEADTRARMLVSIIEGSLVLAEAINKGLER